jgi:hypothetical protein
MLSSTPRNGRIRIGRGRVCGSLSRETRGVGIGRVRRGENGWQTGESAFPLLRRAHLIQHLLSTLTVIPVYSLRADRFFS